MRLSARIRKARIAARLTQAELALRSGVSRAAVANWEHGGRGQPASERLQRLALVTGVSHEWLATGRGAMRYAAEPEAVAALDVEMVEDPLELRLLRAFRAAPQRECMRIVEYVESKVPSAPPALTPPGVDRPSSAACRAAGCRSPATTTASRQHLAHR